MADDSSARGFLGWFRNLVRKDKLSPTASASSSSPASPSAGTSLNATSRVNSRKQVAIKEALQAPPPILLRSQTWVTERRPLHSKGDIDGSGDAAEVVATVTRSVASCRMDAMEDFPVGLGSLSGKPRFGPPVGEQPEPFAVAAATAAAARQLVPARQDTLLSAPLESSRKPLHDSGYGRTKPSGGHTEVEVLDPGGTQQSFIATKQRAGDLRVGRAAAAGLPIQQPPGASCSFPFPTHSANDFIGGAATLAASGVTSRPVGPGSTMAQNLWNRLNNSDDGGCRGGGDRGGRSGSSPLRFTLQPALVNRAKGLLGRESGEGNRDGFRKTDAATIGAAAAGAVAGDVHYASSADASCDSDGEGGCTPPTPFNFAAASSTSGGGDASTSMSEKKTTTTKKKTAFSLATQSCKTLSTLANDSSGGGRVETRRTASLKERRSRSVTNQMLDKNGEPIEEVEESEEEVEEHEEKEDDEEKPMEDCLQGHTRSGTSAAWDQLPKEACGDGLVATIQQENLPQPPTASGGHPSWARRNFEVHEQSRSRLRLERSEETSQQVIGGGEGEGTDRPMNTTTTTTARREANRLVERDEFRREVNGVGGDRYGCGTATTTTTKQRESSRQDEREEYRQVVSGGGGDGGGGSGGGPATTTVMRKEASQQEEREFHQVVMSGVSGSGGGGGTAITTTSVMRKEASIQEAQEEYRTVVQSASPLGGGGGGVVVEERRRHAQQQHRQEEHWQEQVVHGGDPRQSVGRRGTPGELVAEDTAAAQNSAVALPAEYVGSSHSKKSYVSTTRTSWCRKATSSQVVQVGPQGSSTDVAAVMAAVANSPYVGGLGDGMGYSDSTQADVLSGRCRVPNYYGPTTLLAGRGSSNTSRQSTPLAPVVPAAAAPVVVASPGINVPPVATVMGDLVGASTTQSSYSGLNSRSDILQQFLDDARASGGGGSKSGDALAAAKLHLLHPPATPGAQSTASEASTSTAAAPVAPTFEANLAAAEAAVEGSAATPPARVSSRLGSRGRNGSARPLTRTEHRGVAGDTVGGGGGGGYSPSWVARQVTEATSSSSKQEHVTERVDSRTVVRESYRRHQEASTTRTTTSMTTTLNSALMVPGGLAAVAAAAIAAATAAAAAGSASTAPTAAGGSAGSRRQRIPEASDVEPQAAIAPAGPAMADGNAPSTPAGNGSSGGGGDASTRPLMQEQDHLREQEQQQQKFVHLPPVKRVAPAPSGDATAQDSRTSCRNDYDKETEDQWNVIGGGGEYGKSRHRGRQRVRIASAWRNGGSGGGGGGCSSGGGGCGGSSGGGGGGGHLTDSSVGGGFTTDGEDGVISALDTPASNAGSSRPKLVATRSSQRASRISPQRTSGGGGPRISGGASSSLVFGLGMSSDGWGDASFGMDLYDKYDSRSRALAAQAQLMRGIGGISGAARSRSSVVTNASVALSVDTSALNPLTWQLGTSPSGIGLSYKHSGVAGAAAVVPQRFQQSMSNVVDALSGCGGGDGGGGMARGRFHEGPLRLGFGANNVVGDGGSGDASCDKPTYRRANMGLSASLAGLTAELAGLTFGGVGTARRLPRGPAC